MKRFLLAMAVGLTLSGCSPKITEVAAEEFVEAVYFHEVNSYSVGVQYGDEYKIVKLPYYIPVILKTDVPEGHKSWYECDYLMSTWSGHVRDSGGCTIHMHSANDLLTGGWNHGKFGSGQTTKIN